MIFAKYQGQWCLAGCQNPEHPGMHITVPNDSPLANNSIGFKPSWEGTYWILSFPNRSNAHLQFFPDARFRGIKISPSYWAVTDRSRITCSLWGGDLDKVKFFGHPVPSDQHLRAAMADAGRAWDERDTCGYRDCAIEEFDLTEGPPPAGAF